MTMTMTMNSKILDMREVFISRLSSEGEKLMYDLSGSDERFVTLALVGEAGELASLIKKRWWRSTTGKIDRGYLAEDIRDRITDIRVYLELIARCFDIEGDKLDERVAQKLENVLTGST